ncbi:MAG TPA: hypothetical protein VJH37_02025 [Candidatus Nanoarchaeia archaeon]|nr:hypothetical protein [Candidatus Nanoarchaeia archaeon]
MRGFFLLAGMILFAGSMYLFYHPELTGANINLLTGESIVDDRPLLDRITENIHKPVSIEEFVQMTPVILLFFSILFAFTSVLMPDGER